MSPTIKSVLIKDKEYPRLLKEVSGAPSKIYYLGKLPKEDEVLISIVGTRKASREGIDTAKSLARDLAQKGITIVSGLALGIDAAAHEGALLGNGKTIAVLGNGVKEVYPRRHFGLAQQMLKTNGCLLSERQETGNYYDALFLERNRIISGLSLGVIIIEASIDSGSLSTARHALNQGREVLVVPGPANHPNYKGSHMLLRDGARLITSAEDVIEDLGLGEFKTVAKNDYSVISNKEQLLILSAMQNTKEPLDVDSISEITKLEPYIVNRNLTFLTIEGLLEEKNGKFLSKS
ncbi:MAG: DNA-processing protein DprA [Patescibacteria group bacterium]